MHVDLFDFELPQETIAQHPASPRDSARMLDLTGNGFADRIVRDLPDVLQPGDLLVCNDTKVIPTRITGKRGDATVEVTLHKQEAPNKWWAFARPAKKLRVGETFTVTDGFHAEVQEKRDGGEVLLAFNLSGNELITELWSHGIMPLPPYIRRTKGGDAAEEAEDRNDYQTLFAKEEGAVAAPTAGLHFTDELRSRLEAKGISFQTITLHVGAGTFLPMKVEDTRHHVMHSEFGVITQEEADIINKAKAEGRRIVSVGTTSMRLLESAATAEGIIKPFEGETDIFITPGYRFKAVDLLMTNFHLPKSTLFMLVSAFSGLDQMQAAYKHAIETGYRFYSYGDCCLLKCEADHA
ncbi:tRNA preQ1(34) S-adenosylmethionine ribosyltransferase-isomerase QueA [Aestuariispira insulae]|uniref:S-adenosylmethionine:tRNA ribosyltransferase-isomerase n=1 Tax=Aestuariispira insulae TaxID=1461337 RepID=A0A3D9HXK9_9PROT|nr:tRNA preQ1(34) S-adenosylmethionine ribosyltransferase-isomerase QueA [Aestuariispira insulae]RED54238.1 S-adenosylmethionine:tRNA ribosyltransferase-isomerase [Aestuariispira insulae]